MDPDGCKVACLLLLLGSFFSSAASLFSYSRTRLAQLCHCLVRMLLSPFAPAAALVLLLDAFYRSIWHSENLLFLQLHF